MKNKKITFAEKANQIKSKYYKNRKFGDDKITDESFEMEMTNLMKQQESIKGTNNSKQYGEGGTLSYNGGDKANILGPILSTLTSSISAGIASTGMKNAEDILKENSSSSISLPRISAQEINLGRERADIRSQSSMNDAAARYAARNARSASEMARILNSSRLSTQRAAGEMLGKTYSTEEIENAKFRNAADSQNAQIAANEAQLMQNRDQRNLAIDQMYGPAARGRIWSQFATQTGKSIDNYIRENAKLKSDEERLLMENPDMKIDYEYPKDGTLLKNLLYSTGLRKGKKTISVKEKPSVRQKDESIHE